MPITEPPWAIPSSAGTTTNSASSPDSTDLPGPFPPLLIPALWLWIGTGPWIGAAGCQLSPPCLLMLISSTCLAGLLPGPRAILLRQLLPLLIGMLLAPPPTADVASLARGPVLIEGKVLSVPRRHIGRVTKPMLQTTTILKLHQLKGHTGPVAGVVTLSLPGSVLVGRGDTISALLSAGSGSFRKVVRRDHWRVLSRATLLSRADRLRLRALDCLLSIDARWGCALLLGERGLLDPQTHAVMRRTGLGHLLAVSGLHVGICLGFFLIWSRRFLSPWSHIIRGVGAVFLLFQAFLSGADPPAIRAAITGGLIAVGLIGGRNVAPTQALALAMLIWCAMGQAPPRASATISLCAVGGIHVVMGSRQFASSGLRVALGAFFGAHVAIAFWSAEICPFSPLTTLLLLPAVAATIMLGIVTLMLGIFEIEQITRGGWEVLRWVLETIPALADRLPWSPWVLPAIGIPAISLIMMALLWICAAKPRLAIGTLMVASLAISIDITLPVPATMELLATGRGQSVFMQAPGGSLLFDAGSSDQIDGGARLIRRSLWRSGRNRIDWIVLSHAHLDHYSAVPGLLETDSIAGLIVDRTFEDDPAGAAIIQMARRHGVQIHRVKDGDQLTIGPWRLRIISAADGTPPAVPLSLNDRSVVVVIRGPCGTALIPGDAEAARLAASRSSGPIDLVVLPHHGSMMDGVGEWVALLAPEQVFAARPGPLPRATIEQLAHSGIESVPGNRSGATLTEQGLPFSAPLPMMPTATALPLRTLEGWRRWWIRPRHGFGPCTGSAIPMAVST